MVMNVYIAWYIWRRTRAFQEGYEVYYERINNLDPMELARQEAEEKAKKGIMGFFKKKVNKNMEQ